MQRQNLIEIHADELPEGDRLLLAGYGAAGPEGFPVSVNAGVAMVGGGGELLLWIGAEGVYGEDEATLDDLGFSTRLFEVLRDAHAHVGDFTYLVVTDRAAAPSAAPGGREAAAG